MKNKYVLRNCVMWYRKSLGITQKELAERIGVRRETISSIEKGDFHLTSIKFALLIAYELGVGVSDLFWLENIENEEKKS